MSQHEARFDDLLQRMRVLDTRISQMAARGDAVPSWYAKGRPGQPAPETPSNPAFKRAVQEAERLKEAYRVKRTHANRDAWKAAEKRAEDLGKKVWAEVAERDRYWSTLK